RGLVGTARRLAQARLFRHAAVQAQDVRFDRGRRALDGESAGAPGLDHVPDDGFDLARAPDDPRLREAQLARSRFNSAALVDLRKRQRDGEALGVVDGTLQRLWKALVERARPLEAHGSR